MDKTDTIRVNRLKLGMLLKHLREEQGVTQRDAALGAGYAKATFVCNVEKGISSMPIDRIWDFATTYGKGQANELALAIVRLILPDMWDVSSRIFAKAYGTRTKPEEIAEKVDQWVEGMFKQHNISL